MSHLCKWLHEQLARLPVTSFPFRLGDLPESGIYFFYEKGESWGHGGTQPRIVRIGTHKNRNFRNRIAEHFLLDERRMNFDARSAAPHERSIFRKNIGRAILNKETDKYLEVWEIDFTSRESRQKRGHLRNIDKEKQLERTITRILRENFSFRFAVIDEQAVRMGPKGLERRLIGTVSNCKDCRASDSWLGLYSPQPKIQHSGLWLVQHLGALPITERDMALIAEVIAKQTTR